MAGYQFFHIECYGREESTKGRTQTKRNQMAPTQARRLARTRGAMFVGSSQKKREQDSCHHIEAPQPPTVLMGNLDQVEAEATAWAEEATDERGRKLRKDGACLLAGVISLPRSQEAQWEQFKSKSVDWLKEKYGDNLRCVIAHEKDESHLTFTSIASQKGQNSRICTKAREHRRSLKRRTPRQRRRAKHSLCGGYESYTRRLCKPCWPEVWTCQNWTR